MIFLWQLRVYDSERLVYEAELTGPAEIGRQKNREEKQPSHQEVNGRWRVVIAPPEELGISRTQLEVTPQPDGRFLLENISDRQSVGLPQGQKLEPGAKCQISLPVVIQLGKKTLRLQAPDEKDTGSLESLSSVAMAPGAGLFLSAMQATFARTDEAAGMGTSQLIGWIEAFLGLLHSAAGSEDFYVKAARAVVDLVKLDCGRVLIRTAGTWREQAIHYGRLIHGESEWKPSNRVLSSVLREKKTFWESPGSSGDYSTAGIDAVVAAPILDRHGEVIGAVYGERRVLGSLPISRIEAMLVEVLASGVAAGLARREQEQAALRARLQMEQFFTPLLAAKLADHPELLQGRETEVSVLFCDIRNFSRISEKLGPVKTVEWISDVMSDLSQCVLNHDGVVVDYIGDELMAMWGAPDDQPDHAAQACRAALAMIDHLPELNDRWQAILQEPLSVGIGINSGNAQVGNVGSRIKFKYGALGNTVNLASRVQGATKYLKTPLLITDATRSKLDEVFQAQTRRLCQVRVINIKQPVTLFELVGATHSKNGWADLRLGYEQALEVFSNREFRQPCRILGRLLPDHPNDGPALILLARAVACLVEEPDPFDPVMVLPGK